MGGIIIKEQRNVNIMMSESKRFKYITDFYPTTFVDLETGKHYNCEDIVDLLDKQQSTLSALKEENNRMKKTGLELLDFYEKKLINTLGTEDFQTVHDEISTVRFVLYEMGVL